MKRTTKPLEDYIEHMWLPLGGFIQRTTKPTRDYIHQKLHVLITMMYQESLWRERSLTGSRELSRFHARRSRERWRPSACRFTEFFPFLYVWGWPSRGGVIILEHATAVDCEFLGLNHLNILREGRALKQEDEDGICRKLLHLGAKWWDSEERFRDMERWSRDAMGRRMTEDLKYDPTTRETSQLVVGWPSTGGLWVACLEHCYFRINQYERTHHSPDEAVLLRLARNMDEKCQVLRDHFEAKFYEGVQDVEGHNFVNSWETKIHGEVGPMMVLRGRVYEAASPGPAWWRPESSEDEEDEDDDDEEYDEEDDDEDED